MLKKNSKHSSLLSTYYGILFLNIYSTFSFKTGIGVEMQVLHDSNGLKKESEVVIFIKFVQFKFLPCSSLLLIHRNCCIMIRPTQPQGNLQAQETQTALLFCIAFLLNPEYQSP